MSYNPPRSVQNIRKSGGKSILELKFDLNPKMCTTLNDESLRKFLRNRKVNTGNQIS